MFDIVSIQSSMDYVRNMLVFFQRMIFYLLQDGCNYTVEARKLEHGRPPTPNKIKKDSQHESPFIHVPPFWSVWYPIPQSSNKSHIDPNRPFEPICGCRNHGPLVGPLNTRCRTILRTPKGTIILTTTHIPAFWSLLHSGSRGP